MECFIDFDNVTIKETRNNGKYIDEGVWKIDGEEWLYTDYYSWFDNADETWYIPANYKIYYDDGINLYCDGVLLDRIDFSYDYYPYGAYGTEDPSVIISVANTNSWVEIINDDGLYDHESMFVKTVENGKTFYTASSILDGKYINVKLTVEEGKLKTLIYTANNESDDTEYTIIFSDYGTTVVDYEAIIEHTHTFEYTIDEKYKVAEVTCQYGAQYCGVCTECGLVGGDNLYHGDLADCIWGEWTHYDNHQGHGRDCVCIGEGRCSHSEWEDCTFENGVCKYCGYLKETNEE